MTKFVVAALFLAGCASSGPETETAASAGAPASTEAPPMTEAAAAAMARPPGSYTPDEVYTKIMTIAIDGVKNQTRPKTGKEFNLMLPTDKPRGDEKGEWISSWVVAYYRDGETVNQISIKTQNCNIPLEKLDQAAMSSRIQSQVALVTKTLFVVPFALQDKYFKALGPDWKNTVRVPIKEDYTPVVDMRLMRSWVKCDSRSGYEYRYDIFMK